MNLFRNDALNTQQTAITDSSFCDADILLLLTASPFSLTQTLLKDAVRTAQ